MKLYLATAGLDDIRWATGVGLIDGVLTTHAMLDGASAGGGEDGHDVLSDICRATGLPVLASVGTVGADDIYREGRDLAKLSDQIAVQIPIGEDAVGAIGRLRADGVRVITTLVFGVPQAVLAAKAGAYAVSVAMDQLDLYGHDGADAVRDIVTLFRADGAECDVLAALPQHAAQFARCARAGADVIAVSPAVLRSLFVHPLTDRGLDQWLRDVAVQHRARATA
jgi:transaldolase